MTDATIDTGTRTAPHGDPLTRPRSLDGIDTDDMVVHVRVPGRHVTFCGRPLDARWSYLPEGEVTEAAWCPLCVEIQDGTA